MLLCCIVLCCVVLSYVVMLCCVVLCCIVLCCIVLCCVYLGITHYTWGSLGVIQKSMIQKHYFSKLFTKRINQNSYNMKQNIAHTWKFL